MDSNKHQALKKILESCAGHQACAYDCQMLQELGKLTPRDVAEQVLSGQINENVRNYIMKCDLCGLCVRNCPERLDIPGMVMAARQVLLENGATDAEVYRGMWVDHDWNAITLYRDTYQIDYGDLIKPRCDTLFFPGCFLANEAPELVRSTINWLTEHGHREVGLTLMCCGLPLFQMGLAERAKRYMRLARKLVRDTGARRIVTACPSCHYHLLGCQAAPGVEVVSLYKLMADAGVRAPDLDIGKITVHDSCPDRGGEMGKWVRQILSNYDIVEMAHHGAGTICCGAGGVVSMIDRELSESRSRKRVKELQNKGAELCVTYCMTCCDTLSSAAAPGKVRHILELIFSQFVDHEQYAARLEAMWQDECGKYNTYRLENSHLLESLTDNVCT